MKKLFSLLVLVSLLLITVPQVKADSEEIRLDHLAGRVEYKASSWFFFSSSWQELEDSTSLSKGDLIKTGPKGRAQITFANQARTLIKPNSKLKVVNDSAKLTKVKLSLGEVWVKFIQNLNSEEGFEIETPSAVAGVKGTLFKVVVNENEETQVTVNEGQVEVSSEGGKVLINKGEGAVVKDKEKRPEVLPAGKIEARQKKEADKKGKTDKKSDKEWVKETKDWEKETKKEAKEKAAEEAQKNKEEAEKNSQNKKELPDEANEKAHQNHDDSNNGVDNSSDDSDNNSSNSNNSNNSGAGNSSNSSNSNSSPGSNNSSSNSSSNPGRGKN